MKGKTMIFLRHSPDILNIGERYWNDITFLHFKRLIKCYYSMSRKHSDNIYIKCRVELKKASEPHVYPMFFTCNILISWMSWSDKNTISLRHYDAAWAAIRILKRRHRQQNLHGSEPIIGHSSNHRGRCLLCQKGNNNSSTSSSSESDDSIQLPDPPRHHHQQASGTLQSGSWVGQQNKPITTYWFPWVMAVDTSLPVSSVSSAPARTFTCPTSSNSDAPTPDPASSPPVLYYVHDNRQCFRLPSLSSAVFHDNRDFKIVAETKV